MKPEAASPGVVVERHEPRAEGGLEHAGQDQDRGLKLEPRKAARMRLGGDEGKGTGMSRPIRAEGNRFDHPQGGVEDHPDPASLARRVGCAVKATYRVVVVKEITVPRQALG
ncbi:hypothetical protein [uncultured Maritimibacter sp.]|jgi:hypothetical protein|uniref:hypothetical protein n=1 Tax=uncultured Maritimibacter sp. TaxID=991866 RepID=UPI0026315A0D|nr:hypothetical protein [uncultured Maritimibacter sp.]